MKKRLLFAILLSLILVFEGLAPAQAASAMAQVKIVNKNAYAILVTFSGASRRTINVVPGKNTFELPPGDYEANYTNCDRAQTKKLVIKGKSLLDLGICKKAHVTVSAAMSYPVVVRFWNARTSISATIPAGRPKNGYLKGDHVFLKLPEGRYYYSLGITGACPSGKMPRIFDVSGGWVGNRYRDTSKQISTSGSLVLSQGGVVIMITCNESGKAPWDW